MDVMASLQLLEDFQNPKYDNFVYKQMGAGKKYFLPKVNLKRVFMIFIKENY